MADYKVLIFDWDGTLVNSIDGIVVSVQQALIECGLAPCSVQSVKALIGLGLPEVLQGLYPEQVVDEYFPSFRQNYLRIQQQLEAASSPFYEGVMETLELFRAQSYRLAVATGKSRLALDSQLKARGLEGFFNITRCADETASKPNPQMLREILSYCCIEPKQALMVGDSSFDLKMAINASVDAVAVSYGAQTSTDLEVFNPKQVINHFAELAHWLTRNR